MAEIMICTGNMSKRKEFERILGRELVAVDVDVDEIQSTDTEFVCRAKAEQAYRQLGQPVVVDDSGFELSALNGFPGPLVKWVLKAGGVAMLHRLLPPDADASALAVTCIGYADEAGVQVFTGRTAGTVIAQPRGTQGFGFDPVFVPEGETRSLAEMSDAEKDACSPRGQALASFANYLRTKG